MTDVEGPVRWLLGSAEGLIADLDQAGGDACRPVSERLRASVAGPLRQAAGPAGAHNATRADNEPELPRDSVPTGSPDPGAEQTGDRLWELARAATDLRGEHLDVPGLGEAAAALQDLALELADAPTRRPGPLSWQACNRT